MQKILKKLNQPLGKPLTQKSMVKLLKMTGELLAEGFSLKEAVQFLLFILPKDKIAIEGILEDLEEGKRLDEPLIKLAFPKWVCSQVFLAYHHGDLSLVLRNCGEQLENEQKKRQALLNILAYPLFLIIFLLGMLIAMRYILLPHLLSSGEMSTSIAIIYHSPTIVLGILLLSLMTFLIGKFYFAKQAKITLASFLSRIPLVNRLVRSYYTYYFTQEWSALLKSGLSMKQIVGLMQEKESSPLLNEIGADMDKAMLDGYPIENLIASYSFFNRELTEVIRHGEKVSDLQKKLQLFSKDCYKRLNDAIEKIFRFIQPICFILIAFMIVAVYAAIMLPMFDSIQSI